MEQVEEEEEEQQEDQEEEQEEQAQEPQRSALVFAYSSPALPPGRTQHPVYLGVVPPTSSTSNYPPVSPHLAATTGLPERAQLVPGWSAVHREESGLPLEFPLMLRQCLADAGHNHIHTTYKVTGSTHPEYPTIWRASARLHTRDPVSYGKKYLSKHYGISSHDTMEAAINDAARQALGHVCHKYRNILQDTTRRYYPRREPGAVNYTIAPVQVADTQVTALARYTAVLNTELDAAWEELARLRDQHSQLQAKIVGMPQAAEIPHVEAAVSPKRKRTRYGEEGSSTHVLSDNE